jgi:hypothetical protein
MIGTNKKSKLDKQEIIGGPEKISNALYLTSM